MTRTVASPQRYVSSAWIVLQIALGLTLLAHPQRAFAQAEPAGLGPGSYVAVGVTGSGFDSGYGQQRLLGPTLYVDANVYRRAGFELEARTLRFHDQNDLRQTTYLAGLRFSTHAHSLRPYTKLLAGIGQMTFPFHDAQGRYFVAAPGAGLDWHLKGTRLQVRVLDIEYQYWPQFTFGRLRSLGVSTGVAFKVW